MRKAKAFAFAGLLLGLLSASLHAAPLPFGDGIPAPDLSKTPRSLEELGKMESHQETGGFTTFDPVIKGLEAFSGCVNYCITDLSIRMKIGLPVKFYFSPVIRHNTADFIVQSYPRLTKEPWKEWSSVMGEASFAVTSPLARMMGVEDGLGGGRMRVPAYTKQQGLDFKEADVIGNPFILLTILLDKNGQLKPKEEGCETNGCLERENSDIGERLRQEIEDRKPDPDCAAPSCGGSGGEASDDDPPWYEKSPEELMGEAKDKVVTEIGDFSQKMKDCASSLRCVLENLGGESFSRIFSLLDTVESIAGAIQQLQEIAEMMEDIADAFSALSLSPVQAKFRIERMFCPSDFQPFIPYYLSGLDAAFWRSGLWDVPPTDPHKTSTIINPFSSDRIGPDSGFELWGHIYPRSGFVNHFEDAKVGAVTAVRAMDIVQEMKRKRLRWLKKGFDPKKDKWQIIYPVTSKKCYANIAHTGKETPLGDFTTPGAEYRYAWNYWRAYDCDTNEKGSRIAKISLPTEICL